MEIAAADIFSLYKEKTEEYLSAAIYIGRSVAEEKKKVIFFESRYFEVCFEENHLLIISFDFTVISRNTNDLICKQLKIMA